MATHFSPIDPRRPATGRWHRAPRLATSIRVGLLAAGVLALGACSSGGGSTAGPAKTATTSTSSTKTGSPKGAAPADTSSPPSSTPTSKAAGPVTAKIVGPTLPQPISRAVAVASADGVELIGGRTTAKVSTNQLVQWAPGGTATISGHLARRVHDSSVTLLGGHAFVFGGGDGGSVANVQEVNGASATMAGKLPTGRSDLSAATIGDTAYVIGGFSDTAGQPDVLATTDGRQFTKVATLPRTVRYGAVVTVGSKILVFGGEDGDRSSDAVLAIDPAKATAEQVATLPVRLSHASAFVLNGHVYLAGGETDGVRHRDIYAFDVATGRSQVVGQLPAARSDAAVAVVGSTAYLLGGETPNAVDTVVAVTAP
jgi:hypothetical protein